MNIKNNTKSSFLQTTMSSFKEIPFLIKLLFILGIFTLFQSAMSLIQMKPVNTSYFGTNFPKSTPIIWNLYYFGNNLFTFVVYIKRSFSFLKKYLYFNLTILALTILNSVYFILHSAENQRMVYIITFMATFIFASLIYIYLYSQKKYFCNK
ncbi:MAG: hypothetical protein Q7R95_08170 [bacterium]|nr:hypothetical protein [bacterium]